MSLQRVLPQQRGKKVARAQGGLQRQQQVGMQRRRSLTRPHSPHDRHKLPSWHRKLQAAQMESPAGAGRGAGSGVCRLDCAAVCRSCCRHPCCPGAICPIEIRARHVHRWLICIPSCSCCCCCCRWGMPILHGSVAIRVHPPPSAAAAAATLGTAPVGSAGSSFLGMPGLWGLWEGEEGTQATHADAEL
jgi:hypothetical protein